MVTTSIEKEMTFQERNLRIFKKEKDSGVLWQPRLNNWFQLHAKEGTHLDRHAGKNILEVYDDLNASIRAYMYYRKAFYPVYGRRVNYYEKDEENGILKVFETPLGTLTGFYKRTREGYCWSKHFITDPIVEMFKDRLILGISDEMPGDGDIERVMFVSDIVEKYNRKIDEKLNK